MKKLIILSLALLFSINAFAAHNANLAWDASTSPDVASYRIYKTTTKGSYTYGTTSANFVATVTAPTVAYTMLNISDTVPTYVVVTAVGTSGMESGPSNEISVVAPTAPGNLHVVP